MTILDVDDYAIQDNEQVFIVTIPFVHTDGDEPEYSDVWANTCQFMGRRSRITSSPYQTDQAMSLRYGLEGLSTTGQKLEMDGRCTAPWSTQCGFTQGTRGTFRRTMTSPCDLGSGIKGSGMSPYKRFSVYLIIHAPTTIEFGGNGTTPKRSETPFCPTSSSNYTRERQEEHV